MKHYITSILFSMLMSIMGVNAFADSFSVDGLTYEPISNTEALLTSANKNVINVVVPSQVTYDSKTYNVVSIGEKAFYECRDMTTITLPNTIMIIGKEAFRKCKSLTSITIPDNVKEIRKSTFYDCSGLTKIVIGNGVTTIESLAFKGCTNVSSLTIGNSVSSIGQHVFAECSNLTSVTIPNSVTEIEDYAFFKCTRLSSLIISNSLTSIGAHVFGHCSSLTSVIIPNSVTSIKNGAFADCSALTSVNIPNSVTSIGSDAFKNCSSLTSIIIPNSVTEISDALGGVFGGAFAGCSSLESVTFHCNKINNGFFNLESIREIIIGDEVKIIENGAFRLCTGLTSVYSMIEKPYALPDWDKEGFTFGKKTLNEAILYVPIGTIDKYKATDGWKEFKHIEEWTGPNGGGETPVKDFKDYIYEAGINNNWGAKEQPLYSANKDGIYRGFFYAQEADWSAGRGAFKFTGASNSWEEGDYGLGHINADGLSGTLIDDENSGNIYATPGFYRADVNLGNMTYELTPINSISIIGSTLSEGWDVDVYLTYNPETLAWEGTMKLKAGEFKFRANGSLDINWGGSINNLIQDDSNLKIHEAGTYFIQFFPLCETRSYATLTLVSDPTPVDESTISGECGAYVDYVYDKKTHVLAFFGGDGAMDNYDNDNNKAPWSSYADEIQNIQIDDNITSIGSFAFYQCRNIKTISIPSSVKSIGSSAFEDCTSLTSLTLNEGLQYIGGSAFHKNSMIESIELPNTITSIGEIAFGACPNLKSVNIPNSVTEIGDGTFYGCESLTSINIPDGIKRIGDNLFWGCTNLTDVTIPNSVTTICVEAFRECSALGSITIPESVTEIGGYAFQKCFKLADVYCYAENVPNTDNTIFEGTPIESATLHVPTNSVEAYKAAGPWSGFKEIVSLDEAPDGIVGVKKSNDSNDDYYDLIGRKVIHPQKGLYIRNGKKVIVR